MLAFSLWRKKSSGGANRILAVWLCLVVLDLLMVAAIVQRWHFEYPALMYVKYGWPFLHGPLLFLYTTRLIHPNRRSLADLWHFAPFIAIKLFFIPYLLLSHTEKISYMNAFAQNNPVRETTLGTVMALHGFAYVLLSFFTVRRYRRQAELYFSFSEKVSLSWLNTMLIINLAIWSIVVVNQTLHFFQIRSNLDLYTYLLAALWVFAVGYFGFHQPQIFALSETKSATATPAATVAEPSISADKTPDEASFDSAAKYAKTRLSEERKEEIRLKLLDLMQQKPYLEPNLTIKDISNATGYPIHHISQVINDVFGENLFAFINRHRVAEARERLSDLETSDLNVLHIALACGFNSKSSFNNIFKQYTGVTPTEFRRKALSKAPASAEIP